MNRSDILIEVDELLTRIDDPNLRIFDATILFFAKEGEATAYDKYTEKHIAGASFFDHQNVSDPDNQYMYMIAPESELSKQIGELGINADTEVIFYTSDILACATRAWWVLRYAGHNNVRVLNGGLSAWESAGGKVEQGAHHYEPSKFTCQLRSDMFVNRDYVKSVMDNDDIHTVYTLPMESYGGKYITGSSCLPIMNLMQEMHSFLPNDELKDRLKDEAQHERIITYCGGGIAATVSGMAHLMAGNENVAVYDGSLSEWMGEGLPITQNETA